MVSNSIYTMADLIPVFLSTQLVTFIIFYLAFKFHALNYEYQEFKQQENLRYQKLVDSSREAMILFNHSQPEFINNKAQTLFTKLSMLKDGSLKKLLKSKRFYIFKKLQGEDTD